MKNKVDLKNRIKELEGFVGYFQENIENDPSFSPEYVAAKKVCQILNTQSISDKEIQEIVMLVNNMNNIDHYDGSGWNSFIHQILWLSEEFGYESKLICENRHIDLGV